MFQRTPRLAFGVLLVVSTLVGLVAAAPSEALPAARGFDGKTLTVGGLGNLAQLPGMQVGARARIARFNSSRELKGVKIRYTGFADDKGDPATALSEARRLVTQDQVFAIVGDGSQTNPGPYFQQQHVPYFGWAFDNTYCSTKGKKVDTALYGFGFNGCLVPSDPKVMPDTGRALYDYTTKKTGKKHPTIALFSNDSKAGKNTVTGQASAFEGVGFKVVYAKGSLPQTVGDYTPYAEKVLNADHGKAPDVITCAATTDCIPMYDLVKASGFPGTYSSAVYSDLIVKAMEGSAAFVFTHNLSDTTPALNRLRSDVESVKKGATIDSGTVAGYNSADMFIKALKTIAKKGRSNITPEKLQQAAMHQTWAIKGLAGPTVYPQSTVAPYPYCLGLVLSDGSAWNTAEPYSCSKQQYPVLKKFG